MEQVVETKKTKKTKEEKKAERSLMKEKIKLILRSVREYKKYAIICPLFMMGEAMMECAIPFHMSMFLNRLQAMQQTSFSFQPLIGLIIALIIMLLISVTCGVFGAIYGAKASTGLAKNLRSDLYRKIESFSFGNIDKFSASSLITRMTTDINNIQMAFQLCVRVVIRAPLMLIFSAIMSFITGGLLAFIFIVLIPIVVVGFAVIIVKALAIFRRVFKRYDTLNESVEENVSGIRVVKSYVREKYEQDKFNQASDGIALELIKGEKIATLAMPIMNTVIHASNIMVLGIGSLAILQNWEIGGQAKIEIGTISALITYGIQILTSLMMISMILIMLVMSIEGINRVGEVLMEESQIKNPENPIYEIKDGSVEFKKVNFKYKATAEKETLSNINLKIKSGQFIGILGGTGSGKTSIINLISRLYDTSNGEVIVGGKNVKDYDLVTLRDNVAVVLQKNVLFSGTIKENLLWGNINATDDEIKKACQIAQAEEFIESFPDKYETHIEQGGTNVSGGQKQRLCIARAILKNPKILILDDSTSAVDTKTDSLIRRGLKDIIPETTKIVVAQRTSSIQDADQIIIMDKGSISAIGTHEELLKSSQIYKEVYELQNKKGGK